VSAGLNPGEIVVIDGQDKLQDGTKISPTPRDRLEWRRSQLRATAYCPRALDSPEALRRAMPETPRDESVAAVHSTAVATTLLMVGGPSCRLRSLPSTARLRFAAGRLPHDSGANVLSGASPDVMASAVTPRSNASLARFRPERMTSTSSFGSSIITLQFNLDLKHRYR